MTQIWTCHTEDETAHCAQEIASILPLPSIICLDGDMGAGKTAFSRAFIRHILNAPNETVPSPTYTLVQTYDDDQIWHFDLYRLQSPNQLYDIGWEEALSAKLCLIEWPSRLGTLKPNNSVDISIEVLPDGARKITLHTIEQ